MIFFLLSAQGKASGAELGGTPAPGELLGDAAEGPERLVCSLCAPYRLLQGGKSYGNAP